MADVDLDLAQLFADLARTLLAEDDMQRILDRICESAVEAIAGCDHAGVSLVSKREITTPGTSDDVPTRVDRIQFEVDQGPCLDSIRQQETVESADLAAEERWPKFSRRCVEETKVRSMLAVRLFEEEETFGALNLYADEPDAFGDDAPAIGAILAAHAAVAIRHEQEREQLTEAMSSRDLIGQAQGLLMARQGVSSEEAFDMLRKASQRMNIKLRELAAQVVDRNNTADPPN